MPQEETDTQERAITPGDPGETPESEDETSDRENAGDQAARGGAKDDGDEFDRDRALRTIQDQRQAEKRLKRELAAAQAKAKDSETKLRKREEAELSEVERLKRRLDEVQDELSERDKALAERDLQVKRRNFRDAITEAAEEAGAVHPSAVYRLIDMDDVDTDDDGTPKSPDRIVKKLQKTYPKLFRANAGAGEADGGAGRQHAGTGGSEPGAAIDTWLRRSTGRV